MPTPISADTAIPVVTLILVLIVGLAVLFAGRRFFWLFVGLVGFALGLLITPTLFPGLSEWATILVGVVLGAIGAWLAIFLAPVAASLVGFLGGGLAVLAAIDVYRYHTHGYVVTYTFDWVQLLGFAIGGLIGWALLTRFFDATVIALSAFMGAALIILAIDQVRAFANPTVAVLCILVLAFIGISVQSNQQRAKEAKSAPSPATAPAQTSTAPQPS
jgi:hypothetical protein